LCLCSVFLHIVALRPPSSPLFPYTTLFRSLDGGDAAALERGDRRGARTDRPPVHQHRTGAAQGDAAAELGAGQAQGVAQRPQQRSEEHTSELQSRENLVCRLLLEKKKRQKY